jgi:hypothetical protein
MPELVLAFGDELVAERGALPLKSDVFDHGEEKDAEGDGKQEED